jgi:hypothetical protein
MSWVLFERVICDEQIVEASKVLGEYMMAQR